MIAGIITLIFLIIFGAFFGYLIAKVILLLQKIIKLLDRPILPPKGAEIVDTKFQGEPISSAHVVVPKTPEMIEAEEKAKLREQGYNVE